MIEFYKVTVKIVYSSNPQNYALITHQICRIDHPSMKNNSFEVTLRINIFVLLKPTKEVDIDQGKELSHQILHLYMKQTSFKVTLCIDLAFSLEIHKRCGRGSRKMVPHQISHGHLSMKENYFKVTLC